MSGDVSLELRFLIYISEESVLVRMLVVMAEAWRLKVQCLKNWKIGGVLGQTVPEHSDFRYLRLLVG